MRETDLEVGEMEHLPRHLGLVTAGAALVICVCTPPPPHLRNASRRPVSVYFFNFYRRCHRYY